jgi:hypothetical protein
MIEMVVPIVPCLVYGVATAISYFAGRTWHDAYRFTEAENEVREQFDLDPFSVKYKEYPEGYAPALEEKLNSIKFPSWLVKRCLPSYIKDAHAKTRKRPIDSPKSS